MFFFESDHKEGGKENIMFYRHFLVHKASTFGMLFPLRIIGLISTINTSCWILTPKRTAGSLSCVS